DEAGIDLAERLVVQPVAAQIADLVVLDQDVRALDQAPHESLALGRRDIHGERALVPVRAQLHRRLARIGAIPVLEKWRAPAARLVAPAGALDLDDFGAQVAERLGRQGGGQDAAEIENLDSRKRQTLHY